MRRVLLRLRWSWRDLRARWLQVVAIALVIGIGSGLYSGLSSTSAWRQASYDAAYERLEMWDARLELAEGTAVPADALRSAAEGIPSADALAAVQTRLVVPTQVDASTGEETILVPGKLVGTEVGSQGAGVARVEAREGRGLTEADAGRDVAVLDEHFADHYGLPATGEVQVAGGAPLEIVGRGLSAEDLVIIPPQGTIFGEAGYAVLWASLETVQRISELDGQANDLVVRLDPAAAGDVETVVGELEDALASSFGELGATVTLREEDTVLRTLYDDIDSDQRFNDVFAVLILAGAAFAAFNLTGRIVAAQRREIGIGMALGVPPVALATRTLLVGVQIALLGVAFGIGVGYVIQALLAGVLDSVFPLPEWRTDFQPGVFARGAALGFVLPLVATALPVARAVRVAPVDAIRTTHRAASGGLAPLLGRVPLPGSSVAELPFRNVLREPRRTLVTALAIGAAITTLVGVVGMIDSYLATLDRGEEEILGDEPERLVIDLDAAPVDSPPVAAVVGSELLADAEPGLMLGGELDPEGERIEVFLSLVDFDSDLWRPSSIDGEVAPGPGVVLARKAADDLGVGPGDTVVLRHPLREGVGFRLVESEVPVMAVHPNPFRFAAYMDLSQATLFDLEGITNTAQAVPADGVSTEEVQRAFFGEPGVISVQPVRAQVDAIRDRIEEFVGIFTIVQVAVLVLALLIAFNSTSINVDERRREHATMFAFGLPVRSVLGVSVAESLVVGLLGTAIGVVAGRLLVGWLTTELLAASQPDIGIIPEVSLGTVLTAVALGIVAVSVAPLLTLRRLRRMDIPSTLRVME